MVNKKRFEIFFKEFPKLCIKYDKSINDWNNEISTFKGKKYLNKISSILENNIIIKINKLENWIKQTKLRIKENKTSRKNTILLNNIFKGGKNGKRKINRKIKRIKRK